MFLESRQHRSSFWGCAEILQTPKNPIRRPTLLHLFPKCKSAARIRCRLEVLPQVLFFSFLLDKTWANRSVVTELVFLSCCNCTCFKRLVPKKWILQSKSQNPRILLTTLDWREQHLAHKRSLLLQPNTQNTNASTAESSKFSDGLIGTQTASDCPPNSQEGFYSGP